jgi:predicted RNase H-like HicB family nuclease
MSKKTEKFKYPIEVFWSDEDEGYIALVPDLPGCSAWGETEAEALLEAQDAAHAWIKAAKKAGKAIPSPSVDANFSGKFVMRVPKRLHAELTRRAKLEGVSLNQYVLFLLSAGQSEPQYKANHG